jgi:DNA polymerase III alpha subunit (gram-positive type)
MSKPVAKFGLSIDWETSGSKWGSLEETIQEFQGLSFGAIVFDLTTFEIVDSIYHEIQFDSTKYEWSDQAEKVHGLTRTYLLQEGVTQEEAAVDLANLIIKWFGTQEVVFCGHNIAFDIAFTRQLLQPFGVMPRVSSRQIDTSSIGWALFDIYKSEELYQFLGLPARSEHNALEDAMYTIMALETIRTIAKELLQ